LGDAYIFAGMPTNAAQGALAGAAIISAIGTSGQIGPAWPDSGRMVGQAGIGHNARL